MSTDSSADIVKPLTREKEKEGMLSQLQSFEKKMESVVVKMSGINSMSKEWDMLIAQRNELISKIYMVKTKLEFIKLRKRALGDEIPIYPMILPVK